MKVRVNGLYKYNPVMYDQIYADFDLAVGTVVQVRNLYGCPPANTMGMCYIFKKGSKGKDGFIGMVFTNSLEKIVKEEK